MKQLFIKHMTNKWKTVKANSNLIQSSTGKAVLIKLPKSELMFWHPAKCVKQSGKGGYLMEISYTDEFKFKAFRNGKGKSTFNVKIEEKELNSAEFEAYFGIDSEVGGRSEVAENLESVAEICDAPNEEVIGSKIESVVVAEPSARQKKNRKYKDNRMATLTDSCEKGIRLLESSGIDEAVKVALETNISTFKQHLSLIDVELSLKGRGDGLSSYLMGVFLEIFGYSEKSGNSEVGTKYSEMKWKLYRLANELKFGLHASRFVRENLGMFGLEFSTTGKTLRYL